MQSVCVRFMPPHPPSARSRDRNRVNSDPSYLRLGQPSRSTRREKSGKQTRTNRAEDEKLPYSLEVSCSSPNPSEPNSLSSLGTDPRGTSFDSHLQRGTSVDSQRLAGTSRTGRELDRKIRVDIENGVRALERRNEELSEANEQLEHKVELLRNTTEEYRLKIGALERDNGELKIQLDKLEKENTGLREQGLEEWQRRVKLEEDLVSLKASMDREIHSLKEELEVSKRVATKEETDGGRGRADLEIQDFAATRDKVKRLDLAVQNLQAENERLVSENSELVKCLRAQKFKDAGSPRTARFDPNSVRLLDCHLASTWTSSSTAKGGREPPVKVQFAVLEDGNRREGLTNKKPGISAETLPPIAVKEAPMSRRQWKAQTSFSGIR